MRKLSAYLGAVAAGTLALSMQAQGQVIDITIDAGAQTSPTAASCTGFDLLFSGNDCTYNETSAFGGAWIGYQTRDGFFAAGDAQIFTDTGIPANPVGVPISGTLQIDTTGECSAHTIAGTVEMGAFTRNFVVSGARATDNFPNGITQTIAETTFSSGEANAEGGCDYTLGANGVPALLTGPDGDFPGSVQASAWNAPGAFEIAAYADATTTPNPGASATATIGEGYTCVNSGGNCVSGAVPNVSGGFTFAWNTVAKASWHNIVGSISTNGAGDIIEGFLYLVHDDIEISTFAGQRVTAFAYTLGFTGTATVEGPNAVDDSAITDQDVAVEIAVLANDQNLTDPVTVTISANPDNGTAVVNGSPGAAAGVTVTYTPDAGFFGEDSFEYTVEDATGPGGASSATVTVTVNEVGANDDTASTRRNAPVDINVLANDVGFADPVTLNVIVPPGIGTAEVVDTEGNPVVDNTGNQADLRIRYTPDLAQTEGETGQQDVFTYEVAGAGGGDPDVFVFTQFIQDVPFGVVDSDVSATLNVLGGTATIANGDVSVSGIAWESLNVNASADYISDWETELGNGVNVIKIDESCEQVDGTNASACEGPRGLVGDWITGELQDGTESDKSEVRVTLEGNTLTIVRETEFVECPGGPPLACNGDNLSISTYIFVSGTPGATDTAEVTVDILNQVPVANAGAINISTAGVAPETASGNVNVATIAGNNVGDAPAVVTADNGANGTVSVSGTTVTYTPNAGFFAGNDTFTYTITDEDGESDSGEITVTIPDVNPALADGSQSLSVGGSTTIDLAGLVTAGNGSPAQHTLAVTTAATDGTCTLDGFVLGYTHSGAAAGSDSCVVTLTDANGSSDTGTYSFTITADDEVIVRLPGGSSSMSLWSLGLLAGLPLLRRRRRLS